MNRLILSLALLIAAIGTAHADAFSQRYTPGACLGVVGGVLDLSAPIYSPPSGNYGVLYAGSANGKGSDACSVLVFTASSSATYTMPQSKVNSFTGSISGTTLTTPSAATQIGAVITGTAVIEGTYVTAGSGTSWTVNNSQTVGSRTLTSTIFPPGSGACFENKSETNSNGGAPLIITATTSTIYGAAGNVSGNPAAQGGPVALFPGGFACLQADTSNNYQVSGYDPGVWYQFANNVASLQWTGLPTYGTGGYVRYTIDCAALAPVTSGASLKFQLAYGGTYQATGYSYTRFFTYDTNITPDAHASDTSIPLTGSDINGFNNGATVRIDLTFANGSGAEYNNSVDTWANYYDTGSASLLFVQTDGIGPLTTTQQVTGVQMFYDSGNIANGLCWLKPRPN